jgi:hypothetical protein
MKDFAPPLRVVSQDFSVPDTTDDLVLADIADLSTAARLAARMSGPTSRAWVEDADGRKLFEAGPVEASCGP